MSAERRSAAIWLSVVAEEDSPHRHHRALSRREVRLRSWVIVSGAGHMAGAAAEPRYPGPLRHRPATRTLAMPYRARSLTTHFFGAFRDAGLFSRYFADLAAFFSTKARLSSPLFLCQAFRAKPRSTLKYGLRFGRCS